MIEASIYEKKRRIRKGSKRERLTAYLATLARSVQAVEGRNNSTEDEMQKFQFQGTQAATLERQFSQIFMQQPMQRHFVKNDESGLRKVIVTRTVKVDGRMTIRSEVAK
jgi:asparagine synthetase B (glutamine-hydrolysing)